MNEKQQIALDEVKRLCLELRLKLDELDDTPTPPPPDNIRALRPDSVEFEGKIGRPSYSAPNGKARFTAGLKIEDGTWLNVIAWGAAATAASTIQKGQLVRVIGTLKDKSYVNGEGILTTTSELTASIISPVIGVSNGIGAFSAKTPPWESQNGTI